jgi:hypothetical protein
MMSGAGGRVFSGNVESIIERVRRAQEQARDAAFEQQVSGLLNELLSDYNDRDIDGIERHIDTVRAALGKDIDGAVDIRFGGSVAKHTYVDGLSDVDALVLLNASELADKPPGEVKAYFERRLKERLPDSDVHVGRLAATVKFSDGVELQLLPAIKLGREYRIADNTGGAWTSIRPGAFFDMLAKANHKCGGKVVPTIKLAKAINATLPERRQVTGYHLEALAVQAFSSYVGTKTTKAMLTHLFERASQAVNTPTPDPTGQSVSIDDHLGPAGSTRRAAVSTELARVAKRMKNADSAHSVAQWKNLFPGD